MNAVLKNQVKCKLRKGDEVVVMTGRSRGSVGKIEKINLKSMRAFVAGANIYKKHRKPDTQNPDGGIVDLPMSIHISNLMLVDPKTKKPTRIGYKVVNGDKVRFARASGQTL